MDHFWTCTIMQPYPAPDGNFVLIHIWSTSKEPRRYEEIKDSSLISSNQEQNGKPKVKVSWWVKTCSLQMFCFLRQGTLLDPNESTDARKQGKPNKMLGVILRWSGLAFD